MGYLSVDRIADGFAFCENDSRAVKRIPLCELPKDIREGCVIREENGAYTLDPGEEARRRNESSLLFQRLMKKPPKE